MLLSSFLQIVVDIGLYFTILLSSRTETGYFQSLSHQVDENLNISEVGSCEFNSKLKASENPQSEFFNRLQVNIRGTEHYHLSSSPFKS
jgi:hypothetical protein